MTSEIVICHSCRGLGFYWHETNFNYHKRESKEEKRTCATCLGSGRLRKEIKTTYEPFKEKK